MKKHPGYCKLQITNKFRMNLNQKNLRRPEEDREIEKAIIMMTDCIKKATKNPKPVLMHSMRVGINLYNVGEPKEVVIAGFLHDLIEDTNCKVNDVKKAFGESIADLVLGCTCSRLALESLRKLDSAHYLAIWEKETEKIGQNKELMVLKIADANDNIDYIRLVQKPGLRKKLLSKHKLIFDTFEPYLKENIIFKEYIQKYQKITTELLV